MVSPNENSELKWYQMLICLCCSLRSPEGLLWMPPGKTQTPPISVQKLGSHPGERKVGQRNYLVWTESFEMLTCL